jgi:hypothetical protein
VDGAQKSDGALLRDCSKYEQIMNKCSIFKHIRYWYPADECATYDVCFQMLIPSKISYQMCTGIRLYGVSLTMLKSYYAKRRQF